MATIETCMAKAGTPLEGLDLAEQHLVDCGYNGGSMGGCDGAWIGAYQSWMGEGHTDVSHEAQYPYLNTDPNLKCMGKPTWNTGAKVTSAITDYGCNEDKLKKLGKYLVFFFKLEIPSNKIILRTTGKADD